MKKLKLSKQVYRGIVVNIKQHINSYIVSVISMLYGIQMMYLPTLLDNYTLYKYFPFQRFDEVIGLLLLVLGITKLWGVVRGNVNVRRFSIVGLTSLWTFLLMVFVIPPQISSRWVLAFTMILLCLSVSWRGRFDE